MFRYAYVQILLHYAQLQIIWNYLGYYIHVSVISSCHIGPVIRHIPYFWDPKRENNSVVSRLYHLSEHIFRRDRIQIHVRAKKNIYRSSFFSFSNPCLSKQVRSMRKMISVVSSDNWNELRLDQVSLLSIRVDKATASHVVEVLHFKYCHTPFIFIETSCLNILVPIIFSRLFPDDANRGAMKVTLSAT